MKDRPMKQKTLSPFLEDLLVSPRTHSTIKLHNGALKSSEGETYSISDSGIPLFSADNFSPEGKRQQDHYDRIATAYLRNLEYPHTQEYMKYLDSGFIKMALGYKLGMVAELCCGHGEAIRLLRSEITTGIGFDVSVKMLEEARRQIPEEKFAFVQGDATMLPLHDACIDSVVMLGGIHHVPDRQRLFSEVFRVLRPGGHFFWREPVSDFFLWRWIRSVIYRLSPTLDEKTERPLLYKETIPPLEAAGFRLKMWRTYGFLGFCFFMNSDVLIFNRLFRFIPGIRFLVRASTRIDDLTLRIPGLHHFGLQVVGAAQKPVQ